jgi:hypothetical protein
MKVSLNLNDPAFSEPTGGTFLESMESSLGSILDGLDRVIDMPNKHADQVLQGSGIKPMVTNQIMSSVEWMGNNGITVSALYIDTVKFDDFVNEFKFCHTKVELPEVVNCMVMTRRDGEKFLVFRAKED